MTRADRWLEALLWPRVIAPALNASPQPLTDTELVALLLSGRLADVDECARTMDIGRGWIGVREGDLAATHPVGSALASWLTLFARNSEVTSRLLALTEERPDDPEEAATRVTLAAMALATDERVEEAVALLSAERESATGLAEVCIAVQLSCRLLELGDRDQAVGVIDDLLGRERLQRELDDQLRHVARSNRWTAMPFDQPFGDLLDLQRTPVGDALSANSRLTSSGLGQLSRDVIDVLLAAPAGPGWRYHDWDDGLQHLLGAWLHEESWGDWGGIRAARRRLGTYSVVQSLLPFPPKWTHNSADFTDLDLIRRSGDEALTKRVAARWWDAQPVEDTARLVALVVAREWLPSSEQCNLALLGSAGDLVPTDQVDVVIRRLIGIVDDNVTERSYVPIFDVSRALVELLKASSEGGHDLVASALTRWLDQDLVLQPLPIVVQSLSPALLSDSALIALQSWSIGSSIDEDEPRRRVAAELLVMLQRRDDRRPAAMKALADGFARAPTLTLAAALMRSSDLEGIDQSSVISFLRRRASESNSSEGWLQPHQLLAAVDDDGALQDVGQYLRRPDIDILSKELTLLQLSVSSDRARKAINPETAAVLQAQAVEESDHPFEAVSPTWIAAVSRAEQLDRTTALEWITRQVAGATHARWQAAHVLGAVAKALGAGYASVLLQVMLVDRVTEVAAEAARQTKEVLSLTSPEERSIAESDGIIQRLHGLSRRPGCLGPLVAGQVLLDLNAWDPDEAAAARSHPSARVRALALRADGPKSAGVD